MPTINYLVVNKTQNNGAGASASVELAFKENTIREPKSVDLTLVYAGNDPDFAAANAIALGATGAFVF
jgi:hypothetical protein